MKSNKFISSLLITELLATPFLVRAQNPIVVPVDSSLVQQEVVEAPEITQANATQAAAQHIIQYTGQDSLYNELPVRETTVPGLTDKQKKKLLKKYPNGIKVDSRAFDLTVEDSTTALDVIDYNMADITSSGDFTEQQKDFLNYEAYRIRKEMSDIVNGYNSMANDGVLTTNEINNILQPKYSFQVANNNRLKEALPEDAYNLIVGAQERFNQYVNRVTEFTRKKLEDALSTPWYKNWKFVVPTSVATATGAYFAGRGKGKPTQQKVEGGRYGGTGVH